MDSTNHNESNLPLMLRLKGTVIVKIWRQVLLVTLYTAGIVSIHNYVDGFQMSFPTSLVSILGSATGLLLVFRNSTAYDRYYEGRRLWSQMTLNIRHMTRYIWIEITTTKDDERPETACDILEKVSAINLLVAFAYSVKNYLREKYSYEEDEIKDLVKHLPRNEAATSKLEKTEENVDRLSPKVGINKMRRGHYSRARRYNFQAFDCCTPTNIPIEISHYLSSYVQSVGARKLCDSSTISSMKSCISSLVDSFTSLERILRTPIPLAYSVHLHHALWLYILALPYQLVGSLNWFTIPAVTIATFALLGVLCIGWEIENPFGYDTNDLPLDDFCTAIRQEVHKIMARPLPPPESWIVSKNNCPLAPLCPLDAVELSSKSVEEIRGILAKETDDSVPVVLTFKSLTDKQGKDNDDAAVG